MIVFHDNNGHLGVEKTRHLIQLKYWWPSMRKDIREYVDSCHTCQTINARTTRNEGCLVPRDIPTEPNVVIFLDHMGPLNEKGDHIPVCIDHATRYMDAVTVPSTSSTHYLGLHDKPVDSAIWSSQRHYYGPSQGIREQENQPIPSQTGNCSSELPTVLATIKRTDRANGTLDPRYEGPFEITALVGGNRAEIQRVPHTPGMINQKIVNVEQLRRYKEPLLEVTEPWPSNDTHA
ncbi:hypothetical protein MRX96_052338 [Rhipicephalus microplus]